MYQIIYIDIDEEITSVIDKLRKSKTTELFLAIPKRALILQSIMSLKLLSREAEKSGKHIAVVTQDPREQVTVEKAGIETRESLEGLDTESEMRESVVPKIQEEDEQIKKAAIRNVSKRKSVEEIGSNDFYEALGNKNSGVQEVAQAKVSPEEGPKRMMAEVSRDDVSARRNRPSFPNPEPEHYFPVSAPSQFQKFTPAGSEQKEKMLRTFFEDKSGIPPREDKPKISAPKYIPVSGKIKKAILILFISGIFAAGGALFYLFVPKAQVNVKVKAQSLEKDFNLRGDVQLSEADSGNLKIPAKLVEEEKIYDFSYPVTGKSASAGKKAKGMVVIYNEYSSASQSLVATTRLETPDKKIFRLTKGVTVPGSSQVDGKTVPGAIEAEVIADAGGEEYNIDPTTFTIPGFAGSPKFEKFSAKSSAKMTGGNAASEGSGVLSLTQTDIAMSKEKAETEAKKKIGEDLKGKLAGGELLFEGAMEKSVLESGALSKAGDVVAEFKYQVKIKAKALVFSEADAKKIFLNNFKLENNSENQARLALEFGVVSADFESATMTIKAHGKLSSSEGLDVEKLKNDLAGKNASEIEEVIKGYPQIAEIEINVHPSFLFEKVPQMTSRIEVAVIN